MKKILITGANSFVGTSVENYLKNTKDEYIIDTLDLKKDNWREFDFTGYDVVFHVAGIAHVDAKKSMESLYYKINTDLTIEVGKIAKESGVKQFIFMSSMIVYHESKSLKKVVITKETKPNPNNFYGNSKLLAEQGLKEIETNKFKVVILRPPMIYGPNSKGNFPRLIKLARLTPIFPNYHNNRSMIYIDNLAEFIRQVIKRELNGTFYPQNKELADTVEIVKYFANKQKHKLFVSKIFNIFVIIGSPFVNSLNKMFASYYYDPKMSEMDFKYNVVSLFDSFDIM